jgi:hypothetical protein
MGRGAPTKARVVAALLARVPVGACVWLVVVMCTVPVCVLSLWHLHPGTGHGHPASRLTGPAGEAGGVGWRWQGAALPGRQCGGCSQPPRWHIDMVGHECSSMHLVTGAVRCGRCQGGADCRHHTWKEGGMVLRVVL